MSALSVRQINQASSLSFHPRLFSTPELAESRPKPVPCCVDRGSRHEVTPITGLNLTCLLARGLHLTAHFKHQSHGQMGYLGLILACLRGYGQLRLRVVFKQDRIRHWNEACETSMCFIPNGKCLSK